MWCFVKVSSKREPPVRIPLGSRPCAGKAPTLQDLEILYVCILGIDVELDARHGNIEEDAVVDLAEGSAVFVGFGRQPQGPSELDGGDAGEGHGATYPVPHCSTLVMLVWRRLLSHCSSSCLWRAHGSASAAREMARWSRVRGVVVADRY